MLNKYQETALSWLGNCYTFFYEVPVRWSSKNNELFILPQRRKWLKWYVGVAFVFSLWLTCVYTLVTQPILHRKSFALLPICILTTGFWCFTVTLSTCFGVHALGKNPAYVQAINHYFQMEISLYRQYQPAFLSPNRRMSFLDAYLLVAQAMNGVPYLIFLICMWWDLDGPYWVLEDVAPDAAYRNFNVILTLLGIRAFFLIPGFLETTRTIIFSAIVLITTAMTLKDFTWVLTWRVLNASDFFKYYNQLCILSNILNDLVSRTMFVAINFFYFLTIQTLWICIRGWGHLEPTIYLFFASYAVVLALAVAVGIPVMETLVKVLVDLPIHKRNQLKKRYCLRRIPENQLTVKRAIALSTIKISYGSYHSMGKRFTINVLDNGLQNIFALVLLFDINGRR